MYRIATGGGYDDGYVGCPCFWGKNPASLLHVLVRCKPSIQRLRVLDAGCGEGKNAVFLAKLGATVDAVDVSIHAIRNARRIWGSVSNVNWVVGDIRDLQLKQIYNIVIAYGLFHCLSDQSEIFQVISNLQKASVGGAYHVLCMFNNRHQDVRDAHPGLSPCLLTHQAYLSAYSSWLILEQSDLDLTESHPHNRIKHTHSLTRILARRTST